MHQESKSEYEAAKELREAQLKYAAVSIVRRYGYAQQATGMSTAERVASLTTKRLIAEFLDK